MYVARNGKVYSAPFGSEYLADNADGVPVVFYRGGWVGPMIAVNPKMIGKADA